MEFFFLAGTAKMKAVGLERGHSNIQLERAMHLIDCEGILSHLSSNRAIGLRTFSTQRYSIAFFSTCIFRENRGNFNIAVTVIINSSLCYQ